MKTYILEANNIYKIGRSSDIKKRITSIRCGNPDIVLVREYEGDFESKLHQKYKHLRYKNEWFRLSAEIITEIDDYVKNHPPTAFITPPENDGSEDFLAHLISVLYCYCNMVKDKMKREDILQANKIVYCNMEGEEIQTILKYDNRPCNNILTINIS